MHLLKEMGITETVFFGILIILFLFFAVINSFVVYHKKMLAKLINLPQINSVYESELLEGIIDTDEKDRLSFSQDLYNKIVPALSKTKKLINQIQRHNDESNHIVLEIQSVLTNTIKEIRNVSISPSPSVLAKVGLADALQNLVDILSNSSSEAVYLATNGTSSLSFIQELEICRIVQELTNNILKHANANDLNIELKQHINGQLMLMVEENGWGFDTDAFKHIKRSSTTGFLNNKTIASLLPSDIQYRSIKNIGIQVSIEMPIN